MTLMSIPVKTPDGLAELSRRTRRLSQRHRTVLLLVDGKRSLLEVQTMAQHAGAPQSCVDDLLAQGLIVITQPTVPVTRFTPTSPIDSEQPDIWTEPHFADAKDTDHPAGIQPSGHDTEFPHAQAVKFDASLADPALEEARGILLSAVRSQARLAGSLTLLRLRRVRTRDELLALLDEVAMRISKPQRALATQETLHRVRQLLSGESEPEPPKF